jgi:DNA-binding NarL/FixJ family response regulator
MKQPTVMLADDHRLLMEAFQKLLETRCQIVGMVSDGLALLESARALKPDLIVLDIAMPLLSGLQAGLQLRKIAPETKLIFLTMIEDPELAMEAMQYGASAYVLKKCAVSELFQAIEVALKGSSYVTPDIARGMQESFIRDPEHKNRSKALTERQREVMHLLAEGRSMKEAADILKVTPRTIAFHKYRMMEDLRMKTTAELIQFAIANHILVKQ